MNKHFVLLHEGEKPFGCEICDYICSLMSKMNKQVVSVQEEENTFGCEICDYSFPLMCKINKHVVSVYEEEIHLDVRFVTAVFL